MKIIALILSLLYSCALAAQPVKIGVPLGQSSLQQQLQQQLTDVYQQLGFEPIFVALPSKRRLKLLIEGQLDADLFRICTPEDIHPAFIMVPVPLATLELHAYSLDHAILQQWQQRSDAMISHIHGFKMAEQQNFAGIRVPVNTAQQAFGLMIQDRVDIVLEDSRTAEALLEKYEGQATIHSQHVADFAVCHMIQQKLTPLLPQLQQLLRSQTADSQV